MGQSLGKTVLWLGVGGIAALVVGVILLVVGILVLVGEALLRAGGYPVSDARAFDQLRPLLQR